jgi:Glycogen recognition site of AMP-activated protein kinase
MEVRSDIYGIRRWLNVCLCLFFMLILMTATAIAQFPVKNYSVKDGKMYIALSKNISEESLDSFILKYDLYDLALKQFLKNNLTDSLKKLGWKLDLNNKELFVISKPLVSFGDFDNPADKILFTEKKLPFSELFPPVSSGVKFGYNRFRNKDPFATHDSVMTFYLRNNTKANDVILSGSFISWLPDAIHMKKTDSGWIADVKLSPGKYWYKFVVDGNWTIDKDNQLNENDGLGNVNSVVYKTNYVFRLHSFKSAKRVYLTGSFNNWQRRDLPMNKTADGWELPLYLADGTHRYRYVVDGDWYADPENPDKFPNEYGEFNSVIRIGKPYLFTLDGYTDAKQVVLAGSFNDWRKDELFMKKTATGWELPYTLGPGNYDYTFIIDGKEVAKAETPDKTGKFNFVIEPNYTFHLKGYDNARNVYLAGDFNNWSPDSYAMKKEDNEWILTVHLSPGKHLYKFVVDGKWIIDPGNKLWEQNEYETGNSVIWIENN